MFVSSNFLNSVSDCNNLYLQSIKFICTGKVTVSSQKKDGATSWTLEITCVGSVSLSAKMFGGGNEKENNSGSKTSTGLILKKAQTTTSAKVKSMLELVTLIPVWKCLWIIIPVHPILCCVFFRRSYKLSSIIQWLFYSWVIQPLRFLDSIYLLSKTCTKKTYGHKNDNLNTETKIRCVT